MPERTLDPKISAQTTANASGDPVVEEMQCVASRLQPTPKHTVLDLFIEASKRQPIVNDLVYFDIGPNFPGGFREAVIDGQGKRTLSRSGAHVDFAIEDAAGNLVFAGPGRNGRIGVQLDKPGVYDVFAQVHERLGSGANEYPVKPRRIRVYRDENAIRSELLDQCARAIPLDDLGTNLSRFRSGDWPQLVSASLEPAVTVEQQGRIDHIAVKLTPAFEVQTDVAMPALVELSKDAAPVRFSLAKTHNLHNAYEAHKPSYHWYAIVQNTGHANARKLGKEFGQFAGLRAIDLNQEAQREPRNAGRDFAAITDPRTSVPVRFPLPDVYQIICFEYENGQPQFGPASKDDSANRWIYRVMHHAPVIVLPPKAYAEAHAAPAQHEKQREQAAANQQTYQQRFTELSARFASTPTPLRALHIEDKTGVITPLRLYVGVDKDDGNYLLVDFTRHRDSKGNENPYVHRSFNGSPHIAVQELARIGDYPEGVIQISLPDHLDGQRAVAFSTHSIATHGTPWEKRLGAALLPGWPTALGLAGGAYALKGLVVRGLIGASAAAVAGGALGAVGLPVLAAGVLGFGLFLYSDVTADVANPIAVGLDVVNLAACLLGAAAVPGALSRMSLTRSGSAEVGRASGGTALSHAAGPRAIAGDRELMFWANAANLTAGAVDSGVLIAPEIVHQIQALSQSSLSEAEKQAATHGLITSSLSLGLLILLGPRQNYAEARAVLDKRLNQLRDVVKVPRIRPVHEDDVFGRIPAFAGGSPAREPGAYGDAKLNFDGLLPFKELPEGSQKDQIRDLMRRFDPSLTNGHWKAINERYLDLKRSGATPDSNFLLYQLASIQIRRTQTLLNELARAKAARPENRSSILGSPDFDRTTRLLGVLPKTSSEYNQLAVHWGELFAGSEQIAQKLRAYLQTRLASAENDAAKSESLLDELGALETIIAKVSKLELQQRLLTETADIGLVLVGRFVPGGVLAPSAATVSPPGRPVTNAAEVGRPKMEADRVPKTGEPQNVSGDLMGPPSPIAFRDGAIAQVGQRVSQPDKPGSNWLDALFDRRHQAEESRWNHVPALGEGTYQFIRQVGDRAVLRSVDGQRWMVVSRQEFAKTFAPTKEYFGAPSSLGTRPPPPPSLLDIPPMPNEDLIATGGAGGTTSYPGTVYRVFFANIENNKFKYLIQSLVNPAEQRMVSVEELRYFSRWQPPQYLQERLRNAVHAGQDVERIYRDEVRSNHVAFIDATRNLLRVERVMASEIDTAIKEVRRNIEQSQARSTYGSQDRQRLQQEEEWRGELRQLDSMLEERLNPGQRQYPAPDVPWADQSSVDMMIHNIQRIIDGNATSTELKIFQQHMLDQKQAMVASANQYARGYPDKRSRIRRELDKLEQALTKLGDRVRYLTLRKPLAISELKARIPETLTAVVAKTGQELPVIQLRIADSNQSYVVAGGNPYRLGEVEIYEVWAASNTTK